MSCGQAQGSIVGWRRIAQENSHMRLKTLISLVAAFLTAASAAPVFAATCESLAATALKDATVTRAEVVLPGKFSPPDGGRRGGGRGNNPFGDLPEFCRVAAT